MQKVHTADVEQSNMGLAVNSGSAGRLWLKLRVPAIVIVLMGAVITLGVGAWTVLDDWGKPVDEFVYYTVTRTDLPIVVTERGNLEAQIETEIRCKVENLTRDSSGNYGTQIIFIVPNGSAVKEGDLLVELDSSAIRERLDEQVLRHQKAQSALVQAIATYENQKLQNETALAEAELDVKLAKLDLEMYLDEEKGTYKLLVDDVKRDIDEANNLILEKQADLELKKIEYEGIRQLFDLGYRNQSDLDQARFSMMRAEDALASAVNSLESNMARQKKLIDYERQMEELRLRGRLETAQRNLDQVKNDNAAHLAKTEAAKIEAEAVEAKERERLEFYKIQMENCKIYAPHDGMVVYAREGRSNSTEIAEGVTVRQRQEILSLPNLNRMQVKTSIHEAVLDQVKPGLPATVKIDAFPDEIYYGVVYDVGVVPAYSGFWSSGIKTYDTIVRIDGEVTNLKPGMTAVVEIHVDRLKDVLTVPVQAVVQRNAENWCYVDRGNGPEKQVIQLGRSNDKFVEVKDGLSEGDRVVLNPMAILDQQNDGGGTISPEQGESEMPESVARSLQERHANDVAEQQKKMNGSTGAGGSTGMRRPPGEFKGGAAKGKVPRRPGSAPARGGGASGSGGGR